MTITYPRAWPSDIKIDKSEFIDDFHMNVTESLARTTTFQSMNGGNTDRWRGMWVTPILTPAQIRKLAAWKTAMTLHKGSFHAYDADYKGPSSVGGTPRIRGASQMGNALVTDGWPPNQSAAMYAGGYIQIVDQYYRLLEDVQTNSSGIATISVWPACRKAHNDNSLIVFNNPVMVAQLADITNKISTDHTKTGVMAVIWEEKL